MTAEITKYSIKKEVLRGFEINRWVLNLRKIFKLGTKSQRPKNQSLKDEQYKLGVRKIINKRANLIVFVNKHFIFYDNFLISYD